MSLRNNLRRALNENVNNGFGLEQSAKNIVSAYKQSIESSTDILGNSIIGINYSILENAFIRQFKTSTLFNFTLLEPALVSSWGTASVKLPAIPPSGIVSVINGAVISSDSIGNLPLTIPGGLEIFINVLYLFFTNHAKSVTINYSGLTPPPTSTPIIVPLRGFVLR